MEKSTFLTPNVIYHKFRTAIDRNIQYLKERLFFAERKSVLRNFTNSGLNARIARRSDRRT